MLSEFVSEVVRLVGIIFARVAGFSLIAAECGLCIVAHVHGGGEGSTWDWSSGICNPLRQRGVISEVRSEY